MASKSLSAVTIMIGMIVLLVPCFVGADGPTPPSTVAELFADFDPRRDPLDVRVVREWERDNIVFRYVTYHVCTFKGRPARMAAFYAFPKGVTKTAGLLHLHGGGQRAFLHEVEFYARRGYACLSINWGGRPMEETREGDPNTDWGAIDPTQMNVPGYSNLKAGDKYLDPIDSPRNNNWYLLTLGARRGLTFLEQQPQVEPEKLGVYGHSMGGSLTVYVAGSDARVKAAAPSVGGSGFRTQPWPLLPQVKLETPNGDAKLFASTLGFESYAPRITAPLLWLGSTNDFHGVMDDTYRTGALIPHNRVRYSFTPHMNHRFTPEFAVTRPLWFDEYLLGNFAFPRTPETRLTFVGSEHTPTLEVVPDASRAIADVHIYYSVDPDPRARFWRSAEATKHADNRWSGQLPILSVDQPLFAFANVMYKMEKSTAEPHARVAEQFGLSSLLHSVAASELVAHQVAPTDSPEMVIDDFTHAWRDWYSLSADNPHHWEFSTRKITDPKWRGRTGQRLSLDVQAKERNELVVVLTENFFRGYRGPQREFIAVAQLTGGDDTQTISWEPRNFQAANGESLSSWNNVDLLSFRAYHEKDNVLLGSKSWTGPQPVFRKLQWAGE